MLPSDAIDNNNWERVAELAQVATATASRYQQAYGVAMAPVDLIIFGASGQFGPRRFDQRE